jgi:hypothetical protein
VLLVQRPERLVPRRQGRILVSSAGVVAYRGGDQRQAAAP